MVPTTASQARVYRCSHPALVPQTWNERQPVPAEMVGCVCGRNQVCPVCGYGWGSMPCHCSGTITVATQPAVYR